MIQLDHIVIAASTLDQGTRHLEQQLGVELASGGQHLGFGTHNRLLHCGHGAYLELIAIDPAQTELLHPIPFGLGTVAMQASIAVKPRLIAWVASTDNMSNALLNHQDKMGKAVTMSRGNLSWTIRQRADGCPVPEGLPTMIDWGPDTPHPCTRLPDVGVRLLKLQVATSIAAHGGLKRELKDPRIFIKPAARPAITAQLQLPNGSLVDL